MKPLPPFKNPQLYDQAFTHRSYLNEAKSEEPSNERLEFLGDSILSFVVSEFFYKNYQEFDEGVMTNLRSLLVNTKSLAEVARELGFGQLLKLSKGEEDSQGRENQSLLADSYEAFIGALFLDQGIEAARDFIGDTIFPKVEELVKRKDFKDPKSLFQEYVQAKHHAAPLYKVLLEEGPSHAKIFTVGVYVKEQLWGQGKGKSKQEAEEEAAKIALEKQGK
ncbi:MAG TPA: ribonuclease III [Patescibacteria group bacterium]|nr:ribonuclease III [Patescibacteria group bacterium]